MSEALADVEARHGVARVLVCCAGIAPVGRIVNKHDEPHPLDLYRKTLEINLVGTFNAMSKFAARLIAAKIKGEGAGCRRYRLGRGL